MRTHKPTSSITLEYPNQTHFVFEPAIIRMYDSSDTAIAGIVTVSLDIGGKTYSEKRDINNNSVVFDMQRYLQMLFVDTPFSELDYMQRMYASPLVVKASLTVDISIFSEDEISYSFDCDCVWGALGVGEQYGGQYKRVWFTKYPFTFQFAAAGNDYFDVKYDNNPSQAISFDIPDNEDEIVRHYVVNPARIFSTEGVKNCIYVAIPNALHIMDDVEGVGVTSYDLELNDSDCGVYLRWIDRKGQYAYYLFKSISKGYSVSADETFNRNSMDVLSRFDNGVNTSIALRRILSESDTISLAAPLVDSDIYDYLIDLGTSPVVDMFVGYNGDMPLWKRVAVAAASRTRTNMSLQDFTVTIQLPEKNIQRL